MYQAIDPIVSLGEPTLLTITIITAAIFSVHYSLAKNVGVI
jgi:hypothetical protein